MNDAKMLAVVFVCLELGWLVAGYHSVGLAKASSQGFSGEGMKVQ